VIDYSLMPIFKHIFSYSGLLFPKGIILPAVSISALTRFIGYIYC